MNKQLVYRKDIQILRGVSVLLVVLYHLDFFFFKSGFLGVDVFFVISGFLMYLLYDANKKAAFFIKRIKRLLPAYFATIIVTLLVAAFITIPVEFNQVVKQAVFGTFISSNIGFWLQNSYFSKAEFNPLLHLWSLGVEAHFYLCVPIIAWFLSKKKYLLTLLLLSSIALCFFMLTISAKTAFFMMPFRLWEFLIGYGVASLLTNGAVGADRKYAWVGLLGLVFILLIPLMAVDGLSSSILLGHPGLFALLVSLSTALVLYYGLPPWLEKNCFFSALESIGQYSYSIYLVHFPIIVLFLYEPFSGTVLKANSLIDTTMILFLIVLFSAALYYFIERPLRKINLIQYKFLIAVPCMIAVICFMGIFFQKQLYTQEEMSIFNAWKDRAVYRCGKLARINPMKKSCEITSHIDNAVSRIFFVGNSHADSIKTTFAKNAEQYHVKVYLTVENTPLMKGGMSPAEVIDEALENDVKAIVLHYSPSKIGQVDISGLLDLAEKEGIYVSLIMPIPVWSEHVPKLLYQVIESNALLPVQSKSDYYLENHLLLDKLKNIKRDIFSVYSTVELFCQDNCKMISEAGIPYYFDNGHLTLTGSEVFSGLFNRIIEDVIRDTGG